MQQEKERFIEIVKEIIRTELSNLNILKGEWHLGKVQNVIDSKFLNVFIDGSLTSQKVPYNPSVTFNANDNVIVVYLNGNPKDKFVISKRSI